MGTRLPRILVADDFPDAADTTAALFRAVGYEAASAYDGAQVLEIARVFRPDLVILDIDMPVMDGLAAARALRKGQTPGVRLVLIALTGRSLASDERDAFEAGFDRHLKKPLLGQDLCDLVASYLPEIGPQASPPSGKHPRLAPAIAPEEGSRRNDRGD